MPTDEVKMTRPDAPGSGRLLQLPPEIRRQIYVYAGLPDHATISLDARSLGIPVLAPITEDVLSPPRTKVSKANEKEAHFGSVHALLLTCRQVYAEVSPVLYSQNTFAVQDHRYLRQLRPCSLNHLANLLVYVHLAGGFHIGNRHYHYTPHRGLLDLSTPWGLAVLAEWKETVAQVGKYFQPGRLHLHLVCDIADAYVHLDLERAEQGAEQVVDTLRRLPVLASCHLRLGTEHSPSLSAKARQLTGQLQREGERAPFRFMDLPAEVRTMILEHTDLVAPGGVVNWRRKKGFKLELPLAKRSSQASLACRRSSGNGCFCVCHYALSSPSCRCWQDPRALFLVSKTFTAEAREVFFRKNCIKIITMAGRNILEEWPTHYKVDDFLTKRLLPSTMPYLCSLKLDWHFEKDDKSMEREARLNWLRTLQDLRQRRSLHLDYLQIKIWYRELQPYHALRTKTPDSILATLRHFIQDIWPLDDGPEAYLPFGTQLLEVELEHWTLCSRYISKKLKGEPSPVERPSPDGREWGRPAASRVTPANDERGTPAWVEEVYLKK